MRVRVRELLRELVPFLGQFHSCSPPASKHQTYKDELTLLLGHSSQPSLWTRYHQRGAEPISVFCLYPTALGPYYLHLITYVSAFFVWEVASPWLEYNYDCLVRLLLVLVIVAAPRHGYSEYFSSDESLQPLEYNLSRACFYVVAFMGA